MEHPRRNITNLPKLYHDYRHQVWYTANKGIGCEVAGWAASSVPHSHTSPFLNEFVLLLQDT